MKLQGPLHVLDSGAVVTLSLLGGAEVGQRAGLARPISAAKEQRDRFGEIPGRRMESAYAPFAAAEVGQRPRYSQGVSPAAR